MVHPKTIEAAGHGAGRGMFWTRQRGYYENTNSCVSRLMCCNCHEPALPAAHVSRYILWVACWFFRAAKSGKMSCVGPRNSCPLCLHCVHHVCPCLVYCCRGLRGTHGGLARCPCMNAEDMMSSLAQALYRLDRAMHEEDSVSVGIGACCLFTCCLICGPLLKGRDCCWCIDWKPE